TELAAVKPLLPDAAPITALEQFAASGVPTTAALAAELRAIVPTLAQVAAPQPRDAGLLDRLQASASRLVRVRPVDAPAGDDPVLVVDRIEAAARAGNIVGARAELAKLSPAQRAPAEAWIAKARARDDALAAAGVIADNAHGALARPAQ